MTTATMSRTEGRELAIERKVARREVTAGRARWTLRDGRIELTRVHPEMRSGPPVAPVRQPLKRVFGEGILASRPSHRLPVTISDYEWWAEESRKAESRELEQRAGEFEAMNRLECSGVM
jgi:hypothetical protein